MLYVADEYKVIKVVGEDKFVLTSKFDLDPYSSFKYVEGFENATQYRKHTWGKGYKNLELVLSALRVDTSIEFEVKTCKVHWIMED